MHEGALVKLGEGGGQLLVSADLLSLRVYLGLIQHQVYLFLVWF